MSTKKRHCNSLKTNDKQKYFVTPLFIRGYKISQDPLFTRGSTILKLIFINVINIRKNRGESMNLQKEIDQWRDQETYKKQSGIHWFVWLLENPKSPISLTGAIDLYHHDIIHILLNRGMEVKDEAVVIGFTMGNSETTKPWVKWLFTFCVRYLYPEGYRFTPDDLAEFEMGYAYGLSLEKKNIHLACFDVLQDVRTIRNIWGINIGKVL